MAKRISNRNTKAEILAAYKELAQQKSSLETQLKNSPPSGNGTNGNRSNGKTASLILENPQTILDIPKAQREAQQVQDTIAQLRQIELGFGSFVSQLSEKLTREAANLAQVRELSQEQRDRLASLHDLRDLDDDTLDTLVREYETCAKEFSERFEQQRETLEQELDARQQAWDKERRDRLSELEEQRLNHQKTCERDEREYRYARQMARDSEAEADRLTHAERDRQLDAARDAQERAWEQRETAIAEREKEARELHAKVEAFPTEKAKHVERGKAMGRHIAQAQTRAAAELRQQEIDSATQRYELQVQGLEATIRDREARIAKLAQQLDATLSQVQELAVKAIEGNANAESLQAVKDIALEQAKNAPRGK